MSGKRHKKLRAIAKVIAKDLPKTSYKIEEHIKSFTFKDIDVPKKVAVKKYQLRVDSGCQRFLQKRLKKNYQLFLRHPTKKSS